MDLTIIVPVYNVENYIRSSLESLYRQGLDEQRFEVIVVNDGTKDKSMEVIQDILAQHHNITVVNQENQGLSVARNTGLKHAAGEYVLFVDSDDMLIDKTLKSLLDCAVSTSVDMVMGDFVKLSDKEIDNFIPTSLDIESIEISGEDAFVHYLNPRECYVWRTLYRRHFLLDNSIMFIPGIYFEDVPFTTECLIKAKRCISNNQPFYIYRQRENSIVSSISIRKILDFNTVIAKLWEMYLNYTLPLQMRKKLMNTIFITFSISVWYVSNNSSLLSQRSIVVSDLKKKVPNLCFTNGVKQKIISFLYRTIPCSYIKLRSLF